MIAHIGIQEKESQASNFSYTKQSKVDNYIYCLVKQQLKFTLTYTSSMLIYLANYTLYMRCKLL